jgi:hypothetical protein
MQSWRPRITYREALLELPKILDILDSSDISEYVFHGKFCKQLYDIKGRGSSDVITKDIDLLVFSNSDVESIYQGIVNQNKIYPSFGEPIPLFGSLDKGASYGMRGIDVDFEFGRLEVRNGLFYSDAKNSITNGDRRAYSEVMIPYERTGYLRDVSIRLRPYHMLEDDMKKMMQFHQGKAAEYRMALEGMD